MNYLLTASLLLLLIAPAYFFLLRYSERYGLNRWLLLLGMAVICLLPTVDFPSPAPVATENLQEGITYIAERAAPVPDPAAMEERLTVDMSGNESVIRVAPAWPMLRWYLAYAIGSGILLVLFAMRLLFILRLHLRSRPEPYGAYRLLDFGTKSGQAFTFFRGIYLSKDVAEDEDLPLILAHERVHANQLHTLDILLSELFLCVFWFHPVAWWLRIKLRANLEYLVDATVARRTSKRAYQIALVRQGAATQGLALALPFSEPTLKGRIRRLGNAKKHWSVAIGSALLVMAWLSGSLLLACGKAEKRMTTPDDSVHLKLLLERLPYPAELLVLQEKFATVPDHSISVTQSCYDGVEEYSLVINSGKLQNAKLYSNLKLGESLNEPIYLELQASPSLGSSGSTTYREASYLKPSANSGDLSIFLNDEWTRLETTDKSAYEAGQLAPVPHEAALRCLLGERPGPRPGKSYWRKSMQGGSQATFAEFLSTTKGAVGDPSLIRFYLNDEPVTEATLKAQSITERTFIQAGAVYPKDGPAKGVVQFVTES